MVGAYRNLIGQHWAGRRERIRAGVTSASERAGGTQEGFTAQLKESVDSIAELSTGGGPNAGMQAFFRWGGSSKDLKDGKLVVTGNQYTVSLANMEPIKGTQKLDSTKQPKTIDIVDAGSAGILQEDR